KLINPGMFEKGFAIGTSAVAEYYLTGGLALVFVGIATTLLLARGLEKVWIGQTPLSIIMRPLSLIFFKKLFWSPRGGALDWLPTLLHTGRNLALLCIVLFIFGAVFYHKEIIARIRQ
ncbi:MAG: O-antigen polysaccharide polymerase Wzy, partial [Proteobacteria bacterium]